MKHCFFSIAFVCVVFAFAILSMSLPVGCSSTSPSGLVLVRPHSSSPKLLDIRTQSESKIVCEFSQAVNVLALESIPVSEDNEEIACATACESECGADGKVVITLAEKTQIGQKYKMRGTVENSDKSSLSFEFFFLGCNDHRCNLVLSEIRDGYSSKKQECEFIEVYAVTSGNTAGLELYSANDGDEKIYRFPAIEVNAGDFITIHLRTLSENCVDELGGRFDLNSKINDTCRSSRDLFAEGTASHLGGDADVILIRESETKQILDAICYAKKSKIDAWKKKECDNACKSAYAAGVWDGESIESAFDADGFTMTHTIARQNLKALKKASFPYPNGAKYWILTANRKEITPGKPNSTKSK